MNKSQPVDALSNSADITKAKAAHVLDALLDWITTAVAQGQSVALISFGAFNSALRRARDRLFERQGNIRVVPGSGPESEGVQP